MLDVMTATAPIQPGVPLTDDEALLALAEFLHRGADPLERTLWSVMLDSERRPLPALLPVDDVSADPDPRAVRHVGRLWDELLEELPGAGLVLVLERPGSELVTDADRAWASGLRAAAGTRGLSVLAFFIASDDGVRPLAPDDAM